jgi:hypothetical protein
VKIVKVLVMLGCATLCAGALVALPAASDASAPPPAAVGHPYIDCSQSRTLCTEVGDSEMVFGEGNYVGHDEPSLLFHSTLPGSGNQMQYTGKLPTEPSAHPIIGKRSYSFQLYATFWFGMVLCDTESYPLQVSDCTPNSDSNITEAGDPKHAGAAYMELQFYPPGYVQQFDGMSCAAHVWCVAMTIDSLSINPVTGEQLNDICQQKVGIEPVNFAYLTRTGEPTGPPNPLEFDPIASGKPDLTKVLTLRPGDPFVVTLHDTDNGLQAVVTDTATHATGSMTASADNGFGQVKFEPNPSTSCENEPYDFHPMYSTSTPRTTAPWAAATYNVAIDTEIGHFDYCSQVPTRLGSCAAEEGPYLTGNHPADQDDNVCFPPSAATLVKVGGCLDANTGFDGTSYVDAWPNGNRPFRPTPTLFTSPTTGENYDRQYSQVAFNTDLPRIEDDPAYGGHCDRTTGRGCTRIPFTDRHVPAAFYPYYTSGHALGGCAWTVGRNVPGFTTRDYGKNLQYGGLLKVRYTAPGGTTIERFNDFQRILPGNPCPRTTTPPRK